jgi:hypothetical protein
MTTLSDGSNGSAQIPHVSWTGPVLGQAAPISTEAAALVDYSSPNQTGIATEDLEEDPELAKLRGTAKVDEEVHRLVSWTTLNDYGTLVGIALPIKNWVGEDYHVIQFWEETSEAIGAMGHPAAEIYAWLVSRMYERAQSQFLPISEAMQNRQGWLYFV